MKDALGHGRNSFKGILPTRPFRESVANELHSGTPKSAPAPVHDAWASAPGGDRADAGPVTDYSATGKSGPVVHDGGMTIRRAASLERLE